MKKIAILPVYNEEKTVINVLNKLKQYVDIIIVVNDGSTDNSDFLIRKWMNKNESNYCIVLKKNKGMATALKEGFYLVCRLITEGIIDIDDLVLNIDADGQHDPKYIPKMADYLFDNGYDMVLARRNLIHCGWYKRFGNLFLTYMARITSGFKFNDIECGYRLLKAKVIPKLVQYYTGKNYSCAQEIGVITARLGFNISNDYMIHIPFYRNRGATARDGPVVLMHSLIALFRVKFGLKSTPLINCKK